VGKEAPGPGEGSESEEEASEVGLAVGSDKSSDGVGIPRTRRKEERKSRISS